MEERSSFNLLGLLPKWLKPLKNRQSAWIQYQGFKTEIDKHIYCATFRTPTKPSSIAWCKTISKR
jgi:hypothetical protein